MHSSWGNYDQVVERPWHGSTCTTDKCQIYNVLQCSPALTEVRTGSFNTKASDASLLNQPTVFHEEPSLGLCSNIISERFFYICNFVRKMSHLMVLQIDILMSKKKISHLAASSPTPGKWRFSVSWWETWIKKIVSRFKITNHNLNLRDGEKIQHDPTSMSILRILSQIRHNMNIYLETFRVAQICCPVVIQP